MDLFFGHFVGLETEVDCNFSKMCDCPLAGVITSHEAYRSWIIFKECKTEHGTANTIQAGVQTSKESEHGNQDISNMKILLDSLDPHLRPVTPDYDDPKSVALLEEHWQLADEYWKVQTELVLLTQKKNKLLAANEANERAKRNLKELQEEKESLQLARDLLSQQKERSTAPTGNSSRNSAESWVIIPRENQS